MITFLANLVIPLFIFTLVLYGTLKRKDIYTPFLEGVMDGFKIVLEIAPTLIALFFAIQIFRSSGALDLIVRFLTPMGKLLKIPKEVLLLPLQLDSCLIFIKLPGRILWLGLCLL